MKRAVKEATKIDSIPKSSTFHRCMTYSRGPSTQISLHSDQIMPETHTQRELVKFQIIRYLYIYIYLYCAFLGTQSALHRRGGGGYTSTLFRRTSWDF